MCHVTVPTEPSSEQELTLTYNVKAWKFELKSWSTAVNSKENYGWIPR